MSIKQKCHCQNPTRDFKNTLSIVQRVVIGVNVNHGLYRNYQPNVLNAQFNGPNKPSQVIEVLTNPVPTSPFADDIITAPSGPVGPSIFLFIFIFYYNFFYIIILYSCIV